MWSGRDLGGQPPAPSRTAAGTRAQLFLPKGIKPRNDSQSSNILQNALGTFSYLGSQTLFL